MSGFRRFSRTSTEAEWPVRLGEAAFHGLAGEVVRAVEPHTEADPAGLLVQLLVAFGNAAGRNAYFVAEADRHYPNLFCTLVGETAKGRKGSSWGHISSLFEQVDPVWAGERMLAGLSSGEGVIHAVRDEQTRRQPVKEDGRVVRFEEIVVDGGVADKRLLCYEPEFASVLRVASRDGSTLSTQLRQAWESGDLGVLTKNSPVRATGAHVSLIGHITVEELQRELTRTDIANGFANRFLWVAVKRSKLLPDGGSFHSTDKSALVEGLKRALAFAASARELTRDDDARQHWHDVYPLLSADVPGLYGALTSRAEAQVMRLALVYALLDCSPTISRAHLDAGLEVWRYCADSAAFIFGAATGDPTADAILTALADSEDGLTSTEIRDLFKRHKSASEIDRALRALEAQGRADQAVEATGGRPAHRWRAATKATKATEAEEAA